MSAWISRGRLLVATPVMLVALGGGIALGATRHAAGPKRVGHSIDIQAVYTAWGNPDIVANFAPDGSLATPRWSICRPPDTSACSPVKTTDGALTPGPTAAGTVFEATATYRGHRYTARTATWLGRLHPGAPPRLNGRPRYGSSVAATRGTWPGGWQPDPAYRAPIGGSSGGRGESFDDVNIEACRTPTARDCVNLSRPGRFPRFGAAPVTIDSAITGWYLFAYDQRYSPDTAFAGVGYLNAASIPVVHAGPTVARSAALGPIVGPPRPTVRILGDAPARDGRVAVARVRCAVPCAAFAQAESSHRLTAGRVTVHGTGLVSVAWTPAFGNRLQVTLYVGDGPRLTGVTHVESRHAAALRARGV